MNPAVPFINYPADILQFTAGVGGVSVGDLVQFGELHVIAAANAAQGETFSGYLTGEIEKTKATGAGTGWGVGDPVYFDGGELTGVVGSNERVGTGTAVAGDNDTTGRVLLSN